MSLETILVSYVKFNLLMFVSYLLWDMAKVVQDKILLNGRALFQLRMARLLFISPVFLPLVVVFFSLDSPTGELLPTYDLFADSPKAGVDIVTIVLFFLVLGISINAIKLARELIELNRLVRDSQTLKKLGNIRLLYSSKVKIPFATGFLKNKFIVLPEDILFSRESLHIVLKHEGHHIRSGDLYWSFCSRLNSILCFWNPASYAWKELLHDLQELACDEFVTVNECISPQAYANCLLRVAAYEKYEQYSLITPMSLWRHSLRVGAPDLKSRINLLYSRKNRQNTQFVLPSILAFCMVAVSLLFFGRPLESSSELLYSTMQLSDGSPSVSLQGSYRQEETSPIIAPAFQPDAFWGMLNK